MQIKIHEAYRIIVSICDSGLIGKKFEEGDKQLDIKESFYAGEEVDEKKAVEILVDMKKEDARTYMSNLSRAKRDIIDIGRNNDNYDGLTALKKSLGTKKEK